MINSNQIPILRAAARKALESNQLSHEEYQDFIRHLDVLQQKVHEDEEKNNRLRREAGKMMIDRRLVYT